jgi:hypothetical protein
MHQGNGILQAGKGTNVGNMFELTKKVKPKTEKLQVVISIICVINGIKLSATDIRVLVHYMVYGISRDSEIRLFENEIVTGIPQLRTIKCKLHKFGFLRRDANYYKSYSVNFSMNASKFTFRIL